MTSRLSEIFADQSLVQKIQSRLPDLFYYAERDSSRGGHVGMEVGSLRERILVSMLIQKFGRESVETEPPITAHDVDAKLSGQPISIKTLSTPTRRIGHVKAIWTVDAEKAKEFVRTFSPTSDYLFAHLVWGDEGALYYLPVEAQEDVFARLGRGDYLRPPKTGTNPRGVEVSGGAMTRLAAHPLSKAIPIQWVRPTGNYDPFDRWVELWRLG